MTNGKQRVREHIESVYNEAYKCGVGANHPDKYRSIDAVVDQALDSIEEVMLDERKEAIEYFYWRIDCNTLISELEGWRGCILAAKDQTERHFVELRGADTSAQNQPNKGRWESK